MKTKYSKELLEKIVSKSLSWAEVCRSLNIKAMTGSQSHIKSVCEHYEISFEHFTGQAWNKGKTYTRKDALTYCFKGSTENSHRLKNRLIKDGYKMSKCEKCGIEEWQGEPVVLELDHIDSDHLNNEISNLQILCPNCHALKTRKRRMAP